MSKLIKQSVGSVCRPGLKAADGLMLGALVVLSVCHTSALAQRAQKEELRQITTPAGGVAASPSGSVTIYGLIDTSLASASGPNGRVIKMDTGHMNGSRLGFKGTEDLGGGLRANFLLEMGVNSDTGSSGQNQGAGAKLFGRGALISLTGGFGEVRLGRTLATIASEAQAVGDPFGLGGAGNLQGIQPATGRSNNTLWYQTPSVSGFIGKASYSAGESAAATDTKRGEQLAASVVYNSKTLSGALAYTTMRHPTDSSKVRWLNSSLAYDFGSYKVFGSFATFKNPSADLTPAVHAALDNNVQLAAVPVKDVNGNYGGGYYAGQDIRSFSLGVAIPVGQGAILAQVVNVDDRGAKNHDATQFGIAYGYYLSKRTTLYVDYGKVNNRNDANYALTGAISQATLDSKGDSDAVHAGIRHVF